MWFSGDHNQVCTHLSTTIPLVSHNKINGWTEDNEGINGREIMKRREELTNRKDRGVFGNGSYCFC